MKKLFLVTGLILIPGILLFSCSDNESQNFEANHFEINFLDSGEFTDKDWIEIDGTRFDHNRHEKDIFTQEFALPTSKIVRDSLGPDKKFESPFNRISIAIMLGEKISSIKADQEGESEAERKYIISNKPVLLTHGILRFHKTDSTLITIKTSNTYPAEITSLELD